MKKIGVIPNLLRDKDLAITKKVIAWLQKEKLLVYVSCYIANLLNQPDLGTDAEEMYKTADALIVIGGDGTILSVAQKVYKMQIPIVGINLGRLGFLADVESCNVEEFLPILCKDDISIDKRMMLRTKVIGPTGVTSFYHALNEMSLTRTSGSRITEFEIIVNEKVYDIYPADGILVATPTGSTAYNLSAGGPIVMPYAKNLILTPICPHTIYSRSIVLSDKDVIGLRIVGQGEISCCIDGQVRMMITNEHIIEVERSAYTTQLLKLSGTDFLDILNKKIVERR
ncbi:MAG: hypothetical protein ATN36_08495 [Epulopiscium sp. Nele67-Bin005]|nr:MAG: hypothetical protein ATN36_08495 [Epulopiscium sp. Nele67-Bin005]